MGTEQKIKEAFDAKYGDVSCFNCLEDYQDLLSTFRAGYLALLNSPELEQCKKDAEWQQIETAPIGEEVLTWNGRYFRVAFRQGPRMGFMDKRTYQSVSPKVTHWKPLPKPPVTDAAIDKAMESV